MSVRDSMAGLIGAVRALVDDPSGDSAVFTDDAVQDALDHTRQDMNYLELAGKQTINPGGRTVWLDYYAMTGSVGLGDWEDDVILQGYPSFAVLSPITADTLVGHWTFDTSTDANGQRPPVYLIGKNYDRYAAAVTILQKWAVRMSRNYDFSSDSQRFMLSQQRTGLLALAAEYKQQARPRMAQMVRNDVPTGLLQQGAYSMNRTSF